MAQEEVDDMNQPMSNADDRKRKLMDHTMKQNLDDTIDDEEVAIHHMEENLPSPKRSSTMNLDDGGLEVLSRTKKHAKVILQHPTPLQRTKKESAGHGTSSNRVGGFDPISLAWLQRMEEIATIWLNMLVQQQHLFRQYQDGLFNEKQRIVEFCSRTLQQILSEGGFRSYTTPLYPPTTMYRRPLPPLQDLPCMVVTLKYWYTTLLSKCQHQTAVGMLPHRVLAPQQMARISVQGYIKACEDEVKLWLRMFKTASTKENPAHEAVWMQQLQKKSVPTYSPVRPKSSVRPVSTSPCTKKVGTRLPSPTDVMLFEDSGGVTSVATSEFGSHKDEYEEDSKPATKETPDTVAERQKGIHISVEKANHMRGLILSLYHANKCPFPIQDASNDGNCLSCPVSTGCRTVKELWNHITTRSDRRCCHQNQCAYGRLALLAEEALNHFGHCKKETCYICGPVLVQIPKVKRDIALALEQRQVAVVEQAILQVVDDITAAVDMDRRAPHEETNHKDASEVMTKPIATNTSSGVTIAEV